MVTSRLIWQLLQIYTLYIDILYTHVNFICLTICIHQYIHMLQVNCTCSRFHCDSTRYGHIYCVNKLAVSICTRTFMVYIFCFYLFTSSMVHVLSNSDYITLCKYFYSAFTLYSSWVWYFGSVWWYGIVLCNKSVISVIIIHLHNLLSYCGGI